MQLEERPDLTASIMNSLVMVPCSGRNCTVKTVVLTIVLALLAYGFYRTKPWRDG
ncbi:MAG: hypothetical protein R6U39_05785 [Candidatus Aegiribacteria sp.]